MSLENNEELMLLSCDGNNLNNLDVSQCKELQSLSCRYNNITSLDIKGLELETIKCDGNDKSSNELISGGETSKKIGIKEKLQQAKQELKHPTKNQEVKIVNKFKREPVR